MIIEVKITDDAEQAYERIIETLEQQAGQEIDADDHAEQVLRQYIAEEYGQLIAQGDRTEQPTPTG